MADTQTPTRGSLDGLPDYLTTREVATVARVHPATCARWLRDGLLPGKRVGGAWRVDRRELVAFLENGGGAA